MIYISKKVIYNKKLIRGKFYLHNDINGGHPALIYKKNDKKNIYKSVQFTTSKGSNRSKMKHNLDPNSSDNQFVMNNPIKVKEEILALKN